MLRHLPSTAAVVSDEELHCFGDEFDAFDSERHSVAPTANSGVGGSGGGGESTTTTSPTTSMPADSPTTSTAPSHHPHQQHLAPSPGFDHFLSSAASSTAAPSSSTPPLIDSHHNNNTICPQPYAQMNGMFVEEMVYAPDSSSTSDIFSSTFSLLSADASLAETGNPEWVQYGDGTEKRFYDHPPPIYYSPPMNSYPQYVHESPPQCPQSIEPIDIKPEIPMEPPEKRPKKQSGGQTARNCQLEYTENFKRFINIPTQSSTTSGSQRSASSANNSDSGVQSPAESDEDGGSITIVCPACKNVYTSARSLTGHIGRTEKCREMIGRDYLEEIARMGKSGCIPDPSVAGEGISPVCPHCNRFISHYKGNIRRHVNSCKKTPNRKDSTASAHETNSSNSSLASYGEPSTPTPLGDDHHHQPCSSTKPMELSMPLGPMSVHPQPPPPLPPQHHFPHPDEFQMFHQIPHQMTFPPQQSMPPQMGYVEYVPMPYEMQPMPSHYQYVGAAPPPPNEMLNNGEPPKMPKPPKHNGMVTPDDPYLCSWCTFSTVYKGNMKRHLISCHKGCNDEMLRKYNFELERLRKSAPNRAGPESLPFVEPKPPQPPGARRPRNPPGTNKNMGRPKKADGKTDKTPMPIQPGDYLADPMVPYGIPPNAQMMDYGPPMGFPPQPMQMHPNPQAYIIKDCDMGMNMAEEFPGDVILHQPAALPGY